MLMKVRTDGSYQKERWRNRVSLAVGFVEALLRRYPQALQEHWQAFPLELLETLMRTQGAGPENPSRQLVTTFIQDGESVLDVGCGTSALRFIKRSPNN